MTETTQGPQAHYFARLAAGHFEIQQCQACQRHQFFPRTLCMHCGDTRLDWVRPAGHGEIYSFSIVRRKAEVGGDYNVALVDLAEGVRMMSRVDGLPLTALRIGMRVRAQVSDGLLVFVPEEAA